MMGLRGKSMNPMTFGNMTHPNLLYPTGLQDAVCSEVRYIHACRIHMYTYYYTLTDLVIAARMKTRPHVSGLSGL